MSGPPTKTTLSTDALKDRLLGQIDGVVHWCAPPAQGSYTKGGLYFTLNPGRPDRSVGSFCVHMDGDKAGRWIDYATGDKGDIIDLIRLSLGCTLPEAFKAAREYLGLETEDPATRRAREAQAARLKAARAKQAEADRDKLARMRKTAEAVWLSAQPKIAGTPVELYLRGRGIDLAKLGYQPGAIRYHPECRYYFDHEDPETGEVTKRWRKMPAMCTAISLSGKTIDCHRTFLAYGPTGRWTKAQVPDAKQVFTDYTGGCVRLCNGPPGPKGGRGLPLSASPPGTRVYIAEGIENALSIMMLRHLAGQPPARVLAACMVHNLAHVDLPDTVTEVVLAADNDTNPAARAMLDRAIAAHAAKGRTVRTWRSDVPGEDLNDALQRVLREQMEGAA